MTIFLFSSLNVLRMLARIAAFLALSATALGLAADRVIGEISVDSAFLPNIFKSSSLPTTSLRELAGGHNTEAQGIAQLALLKRPLSVEALTAIASSSAATKPDVSSNTLAQAAALGWRNVVIQAASSTKLC